MYKHTPRNESGSASFKFEHLYFGIAAVSLILIVWQHWGMNRVLDVYPSPGAKISDRGDSVNEGLSLGVISDDDAGVSLHCETRPSAAFPFCGMQISLGEGSHKGRDLRQFDHLLLWLDHKSSVQDTLLVYLANDETASSNGKAGYRDRSNMHTIMPEPNTSYYSLALQNFSVPSWWVLQHNAMGAEAEPRLDNIIGLGITTGDSNVTRTVDVHLQKAQLTGKWISAQNLYLGLLLSWIATLTLHASYRLYKLTVQLKSKREQTAELEQLNAFLSIQKNEYEELAKTDPLTGIANRAGTRELLQSLKHTQNKHHSLIMFDIDYFKQINDNYGHETGDGVLRKIAALVMSTIRDSDHFARWGGEEFIILCTNTSLEKAQSVAENLRHKIAETAFIEQETITCSFGISAYQMGGQRGIRTMFEAADAAMYKAKSGGRNRIEVGA